MKKTLKLATALLVTSISMGAMAQTEPTDAQIDSIMEEMVAQMNSKLPMKGDDAITLLKVSYNNKTISYNYVISDTTLFAEKEAQKIVTDKTCTMPETKKLITDYNFTYHYNYVDKDKKQLSDFKVNQATCAK